MKIRNGIWKSNILEPISTYTCRFFTSHNVGDFGFPLDKFLNILLIFLERNVQSKLELKFSRYSAYIIWKKWKQIFIFTLPCGEGNIYSLYRNRL